MIDLSNVGVEVCIEIDAPPERVWDLVTDLARTPDVNRETQRTAWVPPHDAAVPGAVFEGTNRMGDREWTVTCHVIEAERPASFEWTVDGGTGPGTTWWYRIAGTATGGSEVHHGFQHGPGFTFLRKYATDHPERAADIIASRQAMLADNMRHTLDCLKADAEAEAATGRS